MAYKPYTKFTGTQTSAENLLTIIQGIVTGYGWTVEFYGDNIISTINLGKKLIIKKDGKYVYLAASVNNNPTGNTASFVTNQISCLKFCQSLTLNTTNNWFLNNSSSPVENDQAGVEFKPNNIYTLYINSDNFILINNFSVSNYSACIIGNLKPVGNTSDFITSGSILGGVTITSARLTQRPFLFLNQTLCYVNKNSSLMINKTRLRQNNFQAITGTGSGGSPFNYPVYTVYRPNANSVSSDMNRGYSELDNTVELFDFMAYHEHETGSYRRLCTSDELSIINMAINNPGDLIERGVLKYEVWPFLKKEVPQSYTNDENWGFGFAVMVEA